MHAQQTTCRFQAELQCPAKPEDKCLWTFLLLPKEVSDTLPRRGRTTVEGKINDHSFRATLEPDGQLSHWLKVGEELREAAGVAIGDAVIVELSPVEVEPDPELPIDLKEALTQAPEARHTWDRTTTLARVDWIHWIVSAKQSKTREKRIRDACDMLAAGKKRVCCFDPSGYYSKGFSAPIPADR
jgi:hypothetical protein